MLQSQSGKFGATTVFTGTMRDFNVQSGIVGMELEHFPGMTEKYLQKILQEAAQQWNLVDALIIHRVGEVAVDDCIVLVAAWSARRAAAFDAARYLIEELKSRAPFWKKERFETGDPRWVKSNTN
ncbi:MAG: molybdenum cofactor biosynthesis protein MoaE [Gammaproteobacteria bacterium]|nr:MAG: molybdenum cofactor biosynthesis protein MoaE [Gammaproteobacteria bacterium]